MYDIARSCDDWSYDHQPAVNCKAGRTDRVEQFERRLQTMETAQDVSMLADSNRLVGMDVYTKDTRYVGSVGGLLPTAPETEIDAELVAVDPVDNAGRPLGPEHIEILGIGTVIQTNLIARVDTLSVDWNGRRVTLPVTLAEIEAMPRESRGRPIA
jgi:hypothetical protein